MKFENIKIQPAEISAKGVSSAPDRLSGTAAENKAVFDRLIKDVVAEKFNGFVDLVRDEIEAIDLPPAGEPGYTPVKGVDYWTDEDKGEMEADVLATLREGELSEIESDVADVSDELCRLEEALAGFSDKTLSIGFTVHGGTSAPEAAGEGDVWINTATPISGWAYSNAEPVNPEEGKVWLIAGEGIALDTLVNGNISICPAGAKQYVGGVWTAVEGRINRGGEWAATEPPCIYLYNNGDECVDVSGGFVSHAYKPNGISSTSVIAPVLSKNADSMDISLAVYYYGAVFSSASVALDDVATIEVLYSSASGSGLSFLVTQTSGQHYVAEARATPEGSSGTATIEVSGLSGKYYFVTEIAATGGAVTIHEIRMNKSASSGVGVRPGSGENVFSPVVDVTAITNGHRVTITDAAGVETFDVMNGETGAPGKDYVLTAADKTEIAEQAAALVPSGGGADIDVIAEAGQIIRVKSVDADGKPTEWESAEYPVGAKIYTKRDIEKMTLEELRAEYEKHPLIYRIETDNGWRADILLHRERGGDYFYGAGLSDYPSRGVCVRINKNAADVWTFDERYYYMATMGVGEGTGLLYYDGSGGCTVKSIDDVTNSIEIETAIAELPVEYLVDGATLPVAYEDFVNVVGKYNKIPNLVIRTMVDDVPVDLNALYVSTDMTTFTTVVKFLSPTTNDIITINLALSAG